MPALYTVAELLEATAGQGHNIAATSVTSISIDSREIEPGALFVSIMGDRFDGHDFVAQAISGGAAVALVSEEHAQKFDDLPIIVVPDALEGLAAIARAARARTEAPIIAVTGSVGKTTTKEAIRQVLDTVGHVHASIKSFNNHWGVPLMLARMPQEAAFGVFEIGMSSAGEISPLSKLVKPDIAVITSIAPAHLENFDSLAGIARAKAEIFDGLEPNGWAILNADHSELATLKTASEEAGVRKVMTYGFDGDADVHIRNPKPKNGGMTALIVSGDFDVEMSISSAGKHRLANATAALLATITAGVDQNVALKALADLEEPDGRGAVQKFGDAESFVTVIDESYNANPASMEAALGVLASFDAPVAHKVLVLGDMLELGKDSADLHMSLEEDITAIGSSRVFLVGQEMGALASVLGPERMVTHADRCEAIADELLNSLDSGDVVMIKGSNGIRLSNIISRIRDRFGAVNNQT